MARRRNRPNPIELQKITIGLIYLACGVNCLLGALVLHVQEKNVYELLIGGVLALVMAFIWLFSNPFVTGRPFTRLNDVAFVSVLMLVLNGLLLWKCWPMVFLVALEGVLITRFYLNNRRKRY